MAQKKNKISLENLILECVECNSQILELKHIKENGIPPRGNILAPVEKCTNIERDPEDDSIILCRHCDVEIGDVYAANDGKMIARLEYDSLRVTQPASDALTLISSAYTAASESESDTNSDTDYEW